ncbi:MAG: NfeD family protein [Campylobacterota bacterium]
MRIVTFLLLFSLYSFGSSITHLTIDSAITPVTTEVIEDALTKATQNGSQLLLLELNTPGGLLSATRDIVSLILQSNLPVAVFVSPRGARAASAGLYILQAAHIAAMAEGTNTGAATPVSMSNTNADESKQKKAINDAAAHIQSLAQLRDRNQEWVLKAVIDGESITATQALERGVIEFVASDTQELISQLEGYKVTIDDTQRVLQLQDSEIITLKSDFKQKILTIITHPNVAYVLLLLAVYGIFFELMNPGSFFPGTVGLVSGILALYALNIIPFNYAGLLLIFLGIVLMIAEVFVAGFGILAIGGIVAFVSGSLLLFDAHTLGVDISLSLIVAFAFVSLLCFIYLLQIIVKSRKTKPKTGMEQMIGMEGEVVKKNRDHYLVHVHSETWDATAQKPLAVGDRVIVTRIEGLTLQIKEK